MKKVNVIMIFILITSILFIGCITQEKSKNSTTTSTIQKTESECSDIEDINERDRCFLNEAYLKFDENICDKISSDSEKWRCYRAIADRMNDLEICDKIQDVKEKGACYVNVAENLEDCEKIEDASSKGICISKFAENLEDCEKIEETLIWRDDCYSRIALLRKDQKICERINDNFIKNMCEENLKNLA